MKHLAARIRALRAAQGANERGAFAVEFIAIFPIAIVILFSIIQGVALLQANTVASSAATIGCNTARLFDATVSDGITASNKILTQAGNTLSATNVAIQRGPQTVAVTVTGNAAQIVPGWPVSITRTTACPTERWVAK